MVRVLIVDDSAVVRQSTKFILASDPEILVVGEAANGYEAVSAVCKLSPDVVTMDIQMPKMDGMHAIREIMSQQPVPIVVVTGIDLDREKELSAQASRFGAVSVLGRPTGSQAADHQAFATRLIEQVKLMSAVRVIRQPHPSLLPALPDEPRNSGVSIAPHGTDIIAIGSSTGGPAALHRILGALPTDFDLPVLIVQHIAFGFVEGLASWLDQASPLRVQTASHGERIVPGRVYIAPDDLHMTVDAFGHIHLAQTEPVNGFRPSISVMFESVARSFGNAALGVILTGMGSDGAEGMLSMRRSGAITLAQDQASCIVFGMPKEAIALGAAQHVVPLDEMAQKIVRISAA